MNTHRLYVIKRRKREVYLKKISIVLSVLLFVTGFGVVLCDNPVSAQDNHTSVSAAECDSVQSSAQKCYKSIQIVYGDTLWEIAREHRTDGYHSTKEYLQEIKEINGLLEDDIHEGQYLTIPYYDVL